MSLPSRERGLKYVEGVVAAGLGRSLPSRERGLKLGFPLRRSSQEYVAPFTGAWIEITSHASFEKVKRVAPFTGAWIEI